MAFKLCISSTTMNRKARKSHPKIQYSLEKRNIYIYICAMNAIVTILSFFGKKETKSIYPITKIHISIWNGARIV